MQATLYLALNPFAQDVQRETDNNEKFSIYFNAERTDSREKKKLHKELLDDVSLRRIHFQNSSN